MISTKVQIADFLNISPNAILRCEEWAHIYFVVISGYGGRFVKLYGSTIFNQEFCSFDEAFREAWQSFDYIAGAESLEDFAEGLCDCLQLQEF